MDAQLPLRILTPIRGVGGWQELITRSIMGGLACLTSVCVQGDLKAVIYGQASRGPRDHVLRLERDVLGGFEELWNMWVRARRTIGDSSGVFSRRRRGHKISQSLNSVIAASVKRRSHRPHPATRTRSKFAFL